MKVLAPAKINLGLGVGPRRADGYHDLCTIFQTISLCDELEIGEADALELVVEGEAPAGRDNLVLRAAEALRARGSCRRGARIRLIKRIPPGGGLGGGSSDAAAALVALDRLWQLGMAREDLFAIALELGSDVPFFLLGGTALGLGRGERLVPIAELEARPVVLLLPELRVATSEAYRVFDRMFPSGGVSCASWTWPRLWDWSPGGLSALGNDLEPAVFALHPQLEALKLDLQQAGAELALMSGSGSTVFGLFDRPEAARAASAAGQERGIGAVLCATLSRAELAAGSRRG